MRPSLTDVALVLLPTPVAIATNAHLRDVGLRGHEGMALWAGVQDGATFAVREVIVPRQEGVRNEHGLMVSVDGAELQRINLHLFRARLRLLAQIHSHPTGAYHSAMDDEYAIATALGSLSIVVPNFARQPFSIASCATYRLTDRGWPRSGGRPEWKAVSGAAASALIRMVEG